MSALLKKYLLSSVAFAPPREGVPAGDPPADPADPELDIEDGDPPEDPAEPDADPDADPEEDDVDPDADPEEDDVDEPAPQPASRGARQFSALRAERREQAEQIARLTRELADARRAPAAPVQQEDPRAEADRLALMSPEDRIQYNVDKALSRHQAQSNQLMSQLLDSSDKTSFEARGATDPLVKKFAAEVERRLADIRTRGDNLPRAVVYTYLLGERVLAQQGKKRPGVSERRARESARPAGSRGDVAPARERRSGGSDALERRLENVEL